MYRQSVSYERLRTAMGEDCKVPESFYDGDLAICEIRFPGGAIDFSDPSKSFFPSQIRPYLKDSDVATSAGFGIIGAIAPGPSKRFDYYVCGQSKKSNGYSINIENENGRIEIAARKPTSMKLTGPYSEAYKVNYFELPLKYVENGNEITYLYLEENEIFSKYIVFKSGETVYCLALSSFKDSGLLDKKADFYIKQLIK